jgi:hypothetical protein
VLRGEANHFITLFQLMLSTGSESVTTPLCANAVRTRLTRRLRLVPTVPELQRSSDILYMRESLTPVREMTEAEASLKFRDLINEALNTKTTQVGSSPSSLPRHCFVAASDAHRDPLYFWLFCITDQRRDPPAGAPEEGYQTKAESAEEGVEGQVVAHPGGSSAFVAMVLWVVPCA